MENQKLTQEELTTLQELQKNGQIIIEELGQIEVAKFSLEQRRTKAEQFLQDVQKQEQEFIQNTTNKYGVGSINPETGEFIPSLREN
jgi:outer membrane receptor protein involved in Fe transport